MYEIGQIVFSKAGRDKSRAFIVLEVSGQYLYLVDGELRPLSKPKKKKAMHIQVTKHFAVDVCDKIKNSKHLLDADIKKALLPYNKPV